MARPLETTYEIARATGHCAATGETIPPGQVYVAALVERPDQDGLERIDYSLAAWEAGARPQPPARLFGSWRAKMHEPGAAKRQFIDDEALLDLFDGLAEATEPGRLAFRFVLALLLIRKRLLRHEGSRGGAMLVRRTKAGGAPQDGNPENNPLIEVADPGMDEAVLAEATEQLGQIVQDEPAAGRAGA